MTGPSQPSLVLKPGAKRSFAALESRLGTLGRITVAVEPLGRGRMETLGADPGMQGMSTTKVLILAALLRDRHGVTGLTATERYEADAAITQSDNDAILALFSALERDQSGLLGASAYATSLLREAGDPTTTVATAPPPPLYATTFGQTSWTPTASVKFFRALALGCLLPPADTAFVIGLMRRIEPSESWGLGAPGSRPSPSKEAGVRSRTAAMACDRTESSVWATGEWSLRSPLTPHPHSLRGLRFCPAWLNGCGESCGLTCDQALGVRHR